MKIDGECLIELIGSCRNKVQVYRSVRMPQLHTSLHFHLTPIVMINGSSRRDLLLNSQNFCHSIPAGTENPCRLSTKAGGLGEVGIEEHSSWAFTVGTITGTLEVRPSRSLVPGKGPLNAPTPTLDMDQTVSRRSEPSSRTASLMYMNSPTLGTYYNPRWRRADIECQTFLSIDGPSTGTVGSLRPTFVPARRVGLAVKLPSAFALEANLRPARNLTRLRYLLGGLRPIETVYLRLSLGP
ncbi:uncharacterized protein LOC128289246, partial [Gossypium arboreum]|uniref:uncharacterized protein LOC128289246 n=1 Tax=Gossypium arboreum TaxID=29729 RepID=UPI0022F151EA